MSNSVAAVYRRIVHSGINRSTPVALVDRIVFSNMVCLIGTVINLFVAQANIANRYYLLLSLNIAYQCAMFACLYLNSKQRYLAGRLVFLITVYSGVLFTGLIQGSIVAIELFFLPLGVLSFTMFHLSERIYSQVFVVLSAVLYLILVNHPEPWIHFGPAWESYSESDLVTNQAGAVGLFVACLFALVSAFDRSLHIIDAQRNELFEERKLASIGTIACNVAHEINSPLTALDLQMYQLESILKSNDTPGEKGLQKLERMKKISQRISVIVRGLKFLSRQEDHDPFTNKKVSSILEAALDLNQDRMKRLGIRFDVILENPDQNVRCKPVALSQVVLNILNNAVDAVAVLPEDRRWIVLEAKNVEKDLEISITDSGMINVEEVQDKIFKRFYTTKPEGRGTGLGLSISKETIEAHGGTIFLTTKNGHTKFVIHLPIEKAEVVS